MSDDSKAFLRKSTIEALKRFTEFLSLDAKSKAEKFAREYEGHEGYAALLRDKEYRRLTKQWKDADRAYLTAIKPLHIGNRAYEELSAEERRIVDAAQVQRYEIQHDVMRQLIPLAEDYDVHFVKTRITARQKQRDTKGHAPVHPAPPAEASTAPALDESLASTSAAVPRYAELVALAHRKGKLLGDLLKFMENRSTATFEELQDDVWGKTCSDETIRSMVSRLNSLLEDQKETFRFENRQRTLRKQPDAVR